ncbi:porin, partial [Kaarinaea lacus]
MRNLMLMEFSGKRIFSFPFWFYCLLVFPVTLYAETPGPIIAESNTSEQAVSAEQLQPEQEKETNTEAENKDPEPAREREQSALEDPLAQRQADRVDRPVEWSDEPNEFNLYGSARIRYRETDSGGVWGDGGSRVGLSGQYQYKPFSWFFGRFEAGVNILDQIDLLLDRKGSSAESKFGDTVFLRLAYVGIETPNNILTIGKNWSTYYQVTAFTDRFQGTGGSASGTYNAGTDGGYTGTGRADRVLQTRVLVDGLQKLGLKPFKLNLQAQYGEPIPKVEDFNYKATVGLSALLETRDDLTFGLAYNHANIDSGDLDALASSGIDGDATALAAGLQWFSENWLLATVIARLKNHETTDQGIYFYGVGWEVYGQYNVHKRWWAVAGWNILQPDSDQVLAGEYEGRYGVLEVRYTFRQFQ